MKKAAIDVFRSNGARIAENLFFWLGLYFALQVLIRVLISSSLRLDEAEQLVLSQWLLPGYSAQPPLYTWLQIILIKVLGPNVLALSLLKNLLLFLAYLFVFLSARRLGMNAKYAVIATLSLMLIPEIAWGSQRDYTHSVLVLTASSATLYASVLLVQRRCAGLYALWGSVIGLGVLTKYNYLIFTGALILALLFTDSGRAALWDSRVLLSLAVAVFCALPYVHWFVTHAGEATSSVHKLHMSAKIGALRGLWDLLRAMASHLMPLVLIYLILFPAGFLPRNRSPKQAAPSISLGVYLVILFALLLTMVFLFHVTAFRTRWMQPLLFVGPIFFFLGLKEEVVRPGARKCFFWVTGTVAVVVLCVVALQVWGAYLFGRYTYLNYPYQEMARDVRTLGFHDGVIVGDRRISAGSLRIQFPGSIALDPELLLSNPYKEVKNRDVLVFWDSERSQIPPESLRDYLKNALGIELSDKAITYVKARYLCSGTRYARAGIIIVPGQGREFVKKVGETNG